MNHLINTTGEKGISKGLEDFYKATAGHATDLPSGFVCPKPTSSQGLMYQFTGWNIAYDCAVGPSTTIFLPVKSCISLQYSIPDINQIASVQVKRNLLRLKLVNSNVLKNKEKKDILNVIQNFCADSTPQNKIAAYTIGWVKPAELTNQGPPIKLNQVAVFDQ